MARWARRRVHSVDCYGRCQSRFARATVCGTIVRSDVARLRANADQCDDLFGLTKGFPEDQVVRTKLPAGDVPRDVGLELAQLDPGESSFALRRGTARVFLMLCTRNVAIAENPPTPEAIRDQLINQRLAAFAEIYMNQLRAAAIIREP